MVKSRLIITTLCIMVFAALVLPVGASSANSANGGTNISATISRNIIGLDESFTLTLTMDGSCDCEPDLSPLKHDFEVGGNSHSSQVNIINGHVSRSKVWRVVLMPKRGGRLTIPSLCCDGNCTMPQNIVVKDLPPGDINGAAVMIEAEVSNPEVTVQAQLIYTVRLLLRQALSEAALSELQPQGVETSVKVVPDDLHYTTTRNGYSYQVIERNYILFPQHAGELKLPPVRLDGILAASRANLRSPFSATIDPFDMIGQRGKRFRLRTKAITVKVVDPAQHDPSQPWLPAQKLTIDDDWQQHPPTMTVGEAATRTITTSVSALSATALPELKIEAPPSFKTYPDKTVRHDTSTSTGTKGQMVQKIAMVPTRAGKFTLPATSMRWWDSANRQWKTANLPAVTVTVTPSQRSGAAAAQTPAPPVQPTAPASPQPQHHLATKPAASPAVAQAPVSASATTSATPAEQVNPWLWISLACVAGWLLTILFFRQRRHQPTAPATPPVDTTPAPAEAAATIQHDISKDQVIRLAQSHRAAETRRTLAAWIATLEDKTQSGNGDKLSIDSFPRLVDEPLRREILYLEHYLFAHNSPDDNGAQSWDGNALAQQLQQLDIEQLVKKRDITETDKPGGKKGGNELPSFYP